MTDGPRPINLTTIINDALGHPDIFGHPYTIPADAVPQTTHVSGPVIEGAGAGRMLEWVLEWWDDDE